MTPNLNPQAGEPGLINDLRDYARFYNAFNFLHTPTFASENTARINAALESGKTVLLSGNDWQVNDSIVLRGFFGTRLMGVGEATRIIWTGAGDKPVIQVVKSQRCEVSDLVVALLQPARTAIQILRDSGAGFAPTKTQCRRLNIDGRIGSANSLDYAIAVGGDGAVDANNDFNVFEDVQVQGYKEAGWLLSGSQSYGNELINCHALGTGKYGVQTNLSGAATFSWRGGSMSHHSIADFRVGRGSYYPFRITGINSENSEMFLDVPQEFFRTIILDGVRWAANSSQNLVAMRTRGDVHVVVRDSHIGDGQNPTVAVTFDFESRQSNHIAFERNLIFSSAENVFIGQVPNTLVGCLKMDEISGEREVLTQ